MIIRILKNMAISFAKLLWFSIPFFSLCAVCGAGCAHGGTGDDDELLLYFLVPFAVLILWGLIAKAFHEEASQ